MALTPQIEATITDTVETYELPSKTYKLTINDSDEDRIIGYVDNLDAVKQAIYHILRTERYSYLIYDNNYGIELEQYIGKDFEYLEATIEDTLREALTVDLRINNITVSDIEKVSVDAVLVRFIVESVYGNLQMEVNINV